MNAQEMKQYLEALCRRLARNAAIVPVAAGLMLIKPALHSPGDDAA